jgi:hypothetical protein
MVASPFTHPWFLRSSLARPARWTNRLGLDTTQGLRISTGSGPLDSGHFRISLPSRAAIPFLPLRLRVTSPGTASSAPEFGLTPQHHPSDSPFGPLQGSVQSLPTRHTQGLGRATAARCPTQTNPGCPGNRSQWQSLVILNVGMYQYFFSDTYVYLLIYLQLSRQKIPTYSDMIPTCRYWIVTCRYLIPTWYYLKVYVTMCMYLTLTG